MSAVFSPARADLESRAGASDKDVELWKAQRALGATATGVRDVWLAVQKGLSIEAAAAQVARDRRRAFSGNAYTAWGNVREPILAAAMHFAFDVEPESRVFHAPTNSRYLASPDGVGVDRDGQLVLAELKTGAVRYSGRAQADAKGYVVQMAWQMYVCGAVRCHYLFEARLGAPGAFEAGPRFEDVIEWEEVARLVHDELLPMADALLAAIDALLEGVEAQIDKRADVLAFDVIRGRGIEAQGKALKEEAWKALLEHLELGGVDVSQESDFAKVTYSPASSSTVAGSEVVVDAEHADVVAARQAVVDAKAALAAVEAAHSSRVATTTTTTKKASLTVSDPQKRKGAAA